MERAEDIIRNNLLLSEKKIALWQKLRQHQFTESLRREIPSEIPAEIGTNYASLCGLFDTTESLCTADFARYCRLITEKFGRNISALSSDGEEPDTVNRKTAYMQNSFSDKAYGIFAQSVAGMTAEYYPGFAQACEEVYDNRCKYAILPLYTSTDGRLISFQKLIAKYDLKICMTTEIVVSEENTMHFALLRRGISVPETQDYTDITLVLPEEVSIGRFLGACEVLGANAVTINTIPLTYADGTQEFCIHFHTVKADITALLLFFEASQIRYTLDGIYTHIRT